MAEIKNGFKKSCINNLQEAIKLSQKMLEIIGDTEPMYGLTLQEKMDRMDR